MRDDITAPTSGRRKPVWIAPWGYAEGWLLSAGLLLVGFALQAAAGGFPPGALRRPASLGFALGFTALLALARLLSGRREPVAWLGRVPAAVCSMFLVVALALLMGLVPQQAAETAAAPWIRRLGLDAMARSWPFLLGMLFFLASLGMAVINRLAAFRWRSAGFLLNHLGLYIAVLGALAGAADVERLLMDLREGEPVWQAAGRDGRARDLPLALELTRFEMETHAPKTVLVEPGTQRVLPDGGRSMFEIAEGAAGRMRDWEIGVERYLPLSMPVQDRFEPLMETGAGPAARVRARHAATGERREGWITCGSFAFPPRTLELEAGVALAMSVPRARAYRSHAVLYRPDAEPEPVRIEVNRPLGVAGWRLYQHSYDSRLGRWSRTSTLELVRDPWLPVVYAGILMMIAGAVHLVFAGGRLPVPGSGRRRP